MVAAQDQILCGHSRLNGYQAKINQNQSELCAECKLITSSLIVTDMQPGGRS